MKSQWNFSELRRNVEDLRKKLPVVLANQAQRFFVDSFRKQGWDGPTDDATSGLVGNFTKWPQRRGNNDGGRALMVKSGRLRRAVANSIRQASWPTVRLLVDVPYAAIHNDGGTINMPAREQIHSLRRSRGGSLRLAKTRTEKQRNRIVAQRRVKIGAHRINMPQRRYMGDSPSLRRQQLNTINEAVNTALKTK